MNPGAGRAARGDAARRRSGVGNVAFARHDRIRGGSGCGRRHRARCIVGGLGLCVALLGATPPATAQTSSPTIWSFLGIGADQNSANPAIQAAAKAKAAKHEICKKKRAPQYLAGLGCTAEHPEVGPALIAAMSDPDEPVRYEAVKAVLQTAAECQSRKQARETRKAIGHVESCHDHCKKLKKQVCDFIDRLCGKAPPKERKCKEALEACHDKLRECVTGQPPCVDPTKEDCPCGNGQGPCCSPEMREKLQQLAYGRDDQGCFLETSERVRTVAEQALKACGACNGGDMLPGGFLDQAVREMPPVDDRETSDVPAGDEACVSDRAVIPVPEGRFPPRREAAPRHDPLALPPPEPVAAPPLAEPVMLPFPAPSNDHSAFGPMRSVLVSTPPPSAAGSMAAVVPTPKPAAPAHYGPARSETPSYQPDTTARFSAADGTADGLPRPSGLVAPTPPSAGQSAVVRSPRWASLPGTPVQIQPPASGRSASTPPAMVGTVPGDLPSRTRTATTMTPNRTPTTPPPAARSSPASTATTVWLPPATAPPQRAGWLLAGFPVIMALVTVIVWIVAWGAPDAQVPRPSHRARRPGSGGV